MSTPIFIVGSPRSGTTLMREVARSIPEVYILPDEFQVLSQFLTGAGTGLPVDRIIEHLEESAFAVHARSQGVWPTKGELAERLPDGSAGGMFEALVRLVANKEGHTVGEYWGDKTPDNALILEQLHAEWPHMKVVHVVRDPRDCVLSMQRSWGRSALRSACAWKQNVRGVIEFERAHPNLVHTVRFEDLVLMPDAVVSRVADWLNVDSGSANLVDINTRERWGTAQGSKGVGASATDWDRQMPPSDVELVESVCSNEMSVLGFQVSGPVAPFEINRVKLGLMRLRDGLSVMRAYADERGIVAALSYKFKQHSKNRPWR